MRFKLQTGLLLMNLLVIVLVVVITLTPSSIVRIILGLPFVLFFPGYALMVALFPRKTGMAGIERTALSFGLSIAVVSIIGLILNYAPWGIRLESMLYSTAAFIIIASISSWFRQRRLPKPEHFNISFQLKIPNWGTSTREKALSIVLLVTIISALGMLGYVLAAPKGGEQLTEFYTLGQEGIALTDVRESNYRDVVEGQAEVRNMLIVGRIDSDDVFFEEKWGRIAIVFVTEGGGTDNSWTLSQGISVRVWRGDELVNESVVNSLNSLEANAETTTGIVSKGYVLKAVTVAEAVGMFNLSGSIGDEIGIGIEGFNEFQVGDILEFYTPTDVTVGKEMRMVVGIVNNEYETVSYRLEVSIDEVKNNEIEEIMLEHGETWENEVSFIPRVAGRNQKVQFLLYKNGEAKPLFEPLRWWMDVKR